MKKITLIGVFALSLAFGLIYANDITPSCDKAEELKICWQEAPEPDPEPLPPTPSMSLVVTLNGKAIPVKNGSRVVKVGELVRVDLRDSDLSGIDIDILPSSKDFEIIDGGRRAYFSSRAGGEYLVLIAGAKGGTAMLGYFKLIVEGDGRPTPEVPAIYGLCEEWMSLVADYDRKVEHTAAVAGVFRELATKNDVDVDSMLAATALANSAVLGESLELWLPFFDKLGSELDEYSSSGKLTTREDYRRTWLAIAGGISNG